MPSPENLPIANMNAQYETHEGEANSKEDVCGCANLALKVRQPGEDWRYADAAKQTEEVTYCKSKPSMFSGVGLAWTQQCSGVKWPPSKPNREHREKPNEHHETKCRRVVISKMDSHFGQYKCE